MKLFWISLAATAALVAGCTKDNNPPTTPTTPAACAYSVSSTSQAPPAAGGTFSVALTKTSGSCTWAASSNASWLTITSAASGSDSTTLTMSAAANSSTSTRGGTITVSWNGGTTQIAVNQSGLSFGECTYAFASSTQTVPPEAGQSTGALSVTGTGCSWTASSNAAWLTITANASGTASAAIAFSFSANPDAIVRGGTITVTSSSGTKTELTVTQSGVTACTYTLTPSAQSVSSAGGSFSFVATRNTQNGCSFSASTTTPWVTLTGATNGLSGQAVPYSVAANTGAARVGTIDVTWSGGNTQLSVTQAAALVAK